ncbi:hypothetical protein SLEP1_g30455 [Rubroshorea leprosula]|nr:hypothetical protein SLEP1_g30455 [Rubroshorea leprosula]
MDRDRDREQRHDHDRRSRYAERRDYEDRHYREASPLRSRRRSRSQSVQATGNGPFDRDSSHLRDGSKEKTPASINLAKLKDLYGDLSERKGDTNERIPMRDTSSEEVIRLGGTTWK